MFLDESAVPYEEILRMPLPDLIRDSLHRSDVRTSLKLICALAYQTAVAKGWHDDDEQHDPGRLFASWIALAHSELSEALEAHRKGLGLDKIGEELADVVIRVMDTSSALGIDLAESVVAKMLKNLDRPPRHGGLPY